MYFSRVEIDSQNRQRIRDLTHVSAYHSWVEDSFPEEIEKSERTRKLWRIDSFNGKNWLLIISEKKPDPICLEKYGVRGTAETKEYEPFLKQIKNGSAYRFKVVLNPVHSVSQGPGVRGRVFPEITAAKQLSYLENRAAKNGFRLKNNRYSITDRRFEVLKKHGMSPVRLCRVTYEGELIVTDQEIFCRALKNGIGRKKAYGFGMMTVIPIPEKGLE